MITKEQFNDFIATIKEKIDSETFALINDDILNLETNIIASIDEFAENLAENSSLKDDKEKLIEANGKLFQKLSFTEKESEENEENEENEEYNVDELFNEKGELI